MQACINRLWIASIAFGVVVTPIDGQVAEYEAAKELTAVDSLARAGRLDEARSALLDWFESTTESDPLDAQYALWLRAVLTVDPALASLDLVEVIYETRIGPWTAPAYVRLAQFAEAMGAIDEAIGHYRVVLRDFAHTPTADEARLAIARLDGGGRR